MFLAEIIAGQRSALICNCIAQTIFNRVPLKSSLKIYLLLQFDFENLGPHFLTIFR